MGDGCSRRGMQEGFAREPRAVFRVEASKREMKPRIVGEDRLASRDDHSQCYPSAEQVGQTRRGLYRPVLAMARGPAGQNPVQRRRNPTPKLYR